MYSRESEDMVQSSSAAIQSSIIRPIASAARPNVEVPPNPAILQVKTDPTLASPFVKLTSRIPVRVLVGPVSMVAVGDR